MDKEIKRWVTSYQIKAHELYYSFPYKKYLTICDSFNKHEIIAICGRILRQLFFHVIHDMVENNVMFKFPPGAGAWMEIQAYSGEAFKIARQNGAFRDVDFLASGFTGYQMVFRLQNRYGKWEKRMYLANRYRDRITELTNQGKQLTSTKVREVRHYVDKLQEKFPILSKSEINKICTYGLKLFAYANRQHCDVLLCNNRDDVYAVFCGKIYLDQNKFWRYWYMKWRMRERLLFRLKRVEWDGYYYIGVGYKEHEELMSQRKTKHFRNVYPVKVLSELYHERWCKHIWRIPYPIDCGWKFFREKIDTDKAEYVGPTKYPKIHKYYKWE